MNITMTLNGKKISADIDADMLLIDFVRDHGCYSVKRGCETSNCGLCTVFLDEKPVLLRHYTSRLVKDDNRPHSY